MWIPIHTKQVTTNFISNKFIFGRVQFCMYTAEVHTTQVTGHHRDYIFTLRPNVYGYSVWNVLYVTILVPRILSWRVDFWKICAILVN